MIATLIVLALIGLIIAYQVFIQGLFSALIMAGLSIVSALVAFNYYEMLSVQLGKLLPAGLGVEGIGLMVLFLGVLLLLRLVTDRLIPGTMRFATLVDRVGASVMGLLTGLVMVGVLVTAVDMMPLGRDLLGFDRNPELSRTQSKNLLFNPDGFVQGLVSQASRYAFAGKARFSDYHPDFQQELYMQRLTVAEGSLRSSSRDCAEVTAAWLPEGVLRAYRDDTPVTGPGGERLIVVRLRLRGGSDDKAGAADPDGKIRMSLAQVRMVGFDASGSDPGVSRYPLGIVKPGWQMVDQLGLDGGKMWSGPQATVDLLFSWPEPMQEFSPRFLEFKGSARAALPLVKALTEAKAPVEEMFAGSVTAEAAGLLGPEDASRGQGPVGLYIGGVGRFVKGDAVGLPSLRVIDAAREGTTKMRGGQGGEDVEPLIEPEPVEEEAGKWREAHMAVCWGQAMAGSTDRTNDLWVPPGYSLAWIDLGNVSGRLGQEFNRLYEVVDMLGGAHVAVGYVLQGTMGASQWSEVAYRADPEALRSPETTLFPEEMLLPEQAVIQKGYVLFLVPQEGQRLGLIGVRKRERPREQGKLWTLAGGVDVVAPPAGK